MYTVLYIQAKEGLPEVKKALGKLKTPEQIVSFLRFIHFMMSDNLNTFLDSTIILTHIKQVHLENGIKKYGIFYPSNKKNGATFILWEDSEITEGFSAKLFDVLYNEQLLSFKPEP
ncbi:hypothetical protein [Endozoicomonas sp.]|uniref:hypothetical protein n=1 Tax=Endozoicomonas sp. TaxID=1892382 RepID=UPI00383BECFA